MTRNGHFSRPAETDPYIYSSCYLLQICWLHELEWLKIILLMHFWFRHHFCPVPSLFTKIVQCSSSAAAVLSGRPIWVSHMDSACTASQVLKLCWYCWTIKNRIRTTSWDHDHCNLWTTLLATSLRYSVTLCAPATPTPSELHHKHHACHRCHHQQLPPLHLPPVTPLSLAAGSLSLPRPPRLLLLLLLLLLRIQLRLII